VLKSKKVYIEGMRFEEEVRSQNAGVRMQKLEFSEEIESVFSKLIKH
jgi:hypothetical protein